jgi:lambda repressor-like predicted transcriptional regulator
LRHALHEIGDVDRADEFIDMIIVQVMEVAVAEIWPMTQDQSRAADAKSRQWPRTIAG